MAINKGVLSAHASDMCLSADKPMQLNQALFMLGGGSGYVPQPDVMRDDAFDPFDKDTLHLEPITVQLQVRLTTFKMLFALINNKAVTSGKCAWYELN